MMIGIRDVSRFRDIGRLGPAVALVIGALLLLAACGGSPSEATPAPEDPPLMTPTPGDPSSGSPTPGLTPTPEPDEAPVVQTGDHPELGTILTDEDGRVLYLFTNDEREQSNCSGGCLDAWPPLLSEGEPAAGNGVSSDRLGTIERDDGSMQVTYNGWPLYYFASDEEPGEAAGQDLNDVWFVVSPHGGPIQTAPEVSVSEHPELGGILVDGSGRTLYLFAQDDPNMSSCTGECARNWPPLQSIEDAVAGDGVSGDLLDTIERDDGSMQVTYNGMPLYYFAADSGPGDVSGHEAGDVWFAVTPDGEAVTAEAPGAAEPETVSLVAQNFEFGPSSLDLITDASYMFEIAGEGSTHTFTVQNPDGETVVDVDVPPGETATAEFTPEADGSYYFFCRPHEGAGMTGEINVGGGEA